jgi:hypothetical protein
MGPKRVELRGAAMSEAKHLVFLYNAIEATDENIVDLRGEVPLPVQGSVIRRRGKDWKVVAVQRTKLLSKPAPIPVYRIFLSDQQ